MGDKYYGGTTKISSLETLRYLISDGKKLQLSIALKKANFADIAFIHKLAEQKAQKIYKEYPYLSRDELIALCIFAYKNVYGGNSSDKTPSEAINLSLFMRETSFVVNYGTFILFLLCSIRQLPHIKQSEVKSLYVLSELEHAHINPSQNWVDNFMSWPSFTSAYTEKEAKTLVRNFKKPVLFKVTGDFYAYDLGPFSNDCSTETIVLEPDTKYLVTEIVDSDDVPNLKVVSVSVQPETPVLDDFIKSIRRPPPKRKHKPKPDPEPAHPFTTQNQENSGYAVSPQQLQYIYQPPPPPQYNLTCQTNFLLSNNTFSPVENVYTTNTQFDRNSAPNNDIFTTNPQYTGGPPPTYGGYITAQQYNTHNRGPSPTNTNYIPPPQYNIAREKFQPPLNTNAKQRSPSPPTLAKPNTFLFKNTFKPPPPPPEFLNQDKRKTK